MHHRSGLNQLLFLWGPIFLIFYFFIIRPQRQQQKKIKRCWLILRKTTRWLQRPVFTVWSSLSKIKQWYYAWMRVAVSSLTVNPLLSVVSNEVKPEVVK